MIVSIRDNLAPVAVKVSDLNDSDVSLENESKGVTIDSGGTEIVVSGFEPTTVKVKGVTWLEQKTSFVVVRDVGIPGPPGRGGSIWIPGEGPPDNSQGDDGDFYLDTLSGDVFYKQSGTWF